MEITLIGWIFIILSIYFCVKNKEYLLYLLVFSSVFTAGSVINIEATVTGIQPFYFVGTIWILSTLFKYCKDTSGVSGFVDIIKNNKRIRPFIILSLVIILSEISLLFFINNSSYINTKTEEIMVVSFSKSNITQPIFLLFMIITAVLLILEMDSKAKIVKMIKVFAIATFFAMIWGVVQFCMYYMSVEYPTWLFNNNISFLQLSHQMIYGLKRVNSIALEPSTFALNILVFLPVVMALWLGDNNLFNLGKKYRSILLVALFLSLICGLLTTSTTAYIGIFLTVIILTIYVLFFSNKDGHLYNNRKMIIMFYLVGFLSLIFVIFLATQVFNMYWGTLVDALKDITINKKNLETGNERTNAILTSINILKINPLLGGGFGSFRSLDLTTNLLSNIGLFGLFTYFYVIYVSLKNVFSNIKSNEVVSLALGLSLIISTIALLISIPDLTFGYYWIIIAIANSYFEN